MWHGAVDIRCIDFVAITASENREPYLALMPVTAMPGDFAVGDTSVDTGGEFLRCLQGSKGGAACLRPRRPCEPLPQPHDVQGFCRSIQRKV